MPATKKPRKYTATQKQRALEPYGTMSVAALSRELGIPKSTLGGWARAAGIKSRRASQVEAAVDAKQADFALQRAKLKRLLLEKAVDMLARMDEEQIDFKGGAALKVEYEKATAVACEKYALAAAILIDKFRLENGEVTGREEVVTIDAIDREIRKLEAEIGRRESVDQRTREPAG